MVQLISLALAASRAPAQLLKPAAANPVNVTANVLTNVEFTLGGPFTCKDDRKPYVRIHTLNRMDIIFPVKTLNSKPEIKALGKHRLIEYLYFEIDKESQIFTRAFNYLAGGTVTADAESRIMLGVCCGVYTNPDTPLKDVYDKIIEIPLKINDIENSAIYNRAILSPEEVRREGDSNIVLRTPWPNACKTEKHPVVKLTLNANTGAKLLVFPSQDYKVYGLVDDKEQNITQVISSTVTQVNGFTALKFVKNTLVKDKYADLDFSFIEWNISHQKVEPAIIDVQFICGGKYVKNCTGEDAPILKIKGGI